MLFNHFITHIIHRPIDHLFIATSIHHHIYSSPHLFITTLTHRLSIHLHIYSSPYLFIALFNSSSLAPSVIPLTMTLLIHRYYHSNNYILTLYNTTIIILYIYPKLLNLQSYILNSVLESVNDYTNDTPTSPTSPSPPLTLEEHITSLTRERDAALQVSKELLEKLSSNATTRTNHPPQTQNKHSKLTISLSIYTSFRILCCLDVCVVEQNPNSFNLSSITSLNMTDIEYIFKLGLIALNICHVEKCECTLLNLVTLRRVINSL